MSRIALAMFAVVAVNGCATRTGGRVATAGLASLGGAMMISG